MTPERTAAMTHDQRNHLRHLIDQAKRQQLAAHKPPPGRNREARRATYRALLSAEQDTDIGASSSVKSSVNPAKRKGDRAELEVQGLLREHLGVPARRQLGAGRKDDVGDIHGVPDTVISVANYTDIARAIREKLSECETQQRRAGASFGAMFCRRRGGGYAVVMSVAQFCDLWREAQP